MDMDMIMDVKIKTSATMNVMNMIVHSIINSIRQLKMSMTMTSSLMQHKRLHPAGSLSFIHYMSLFIPYLQQKHCMSIRHSFRHCQPDFEPTVYYRHYA